jgi:DNA-binding MarR family transcriptional regulator
MQVAVADKIARVISQWASECPDLDTSPMEIIGRVLRIEHLANTEMRRTLRRFGLDLGGFDVLATLRRSGAPYQLTPTQLHEDLVLTSGAVTHRVDALERAELVVRVPDPKDRRSVLVGLTVKGRSIIDDAIRTYLEGEASMISHLKPGERSALAPLLEKLLGGMEARNA